MLPGDVEAFYNASIHGQASGYVREWRKDIGAKVRQGDILAVVDTPELDQRISVAESELVKAKANQQLAHVTAQRWNSLRNSAAVSQQAADEKAERRQRQGRRSSGGAGQRRPAEGAEGVRQHRRAVRRRRHRPQHRHRIAGQGGLERRRGAVHRRRHPSDARLCPRAGVLCGRIEERHEGDPPIAGIPRSHVRGDDRNDLARDRQEVALAARRALSPTTRTARSRRARLRGSIFRFLPTQTRSRFRPMRCCFATTRCEVATLGLDNRIVMKKVRIARDFGSEVEIAGGLSVDERIVANPPEFDRGRRGGPGRWTPSGGRRSRRQDNRALAEAASADEAPTRWRRRSGAAANEAAVLACRADRARARRMRSCAPIRPAVDSLPAKFKDEPAGGVELSANADMVAQLQGPHARRSRSASRRGESRSCRGRRGQRRRGRPGGASGGGASPADRRDRTDHRQQAIEQPAAAFGANQPDYYGNNILGGQVSYEIDIWGRVRDLVKAANLTAEASADALAEARLELHAELARAYVDLRGLDAQAKLLSDTIGIYRSALELTKSRLAGADRFSGRRGSRPEPTELGGGAGVGSRAPAGGARGCDCGPGRKAGGVLLRRASLRPRFRCRSDRAPSRPRCCGGGPTSPNRNA